MSNTRSPYFGRMAAGLDDTAEVAAHCGARWPSNACTPRARNMHAPRNISRGRETRGDRRKMTNREGRHEPATRGIICPRSTSVSSRRRNDRPERRAQCSARTTAETCHSPSPSTTSVGAPTRAVLADAARRHAAGRRQINKEPKNAFYTARARWGLGIGQRRHRVRRKTRRKVAPH